MSIRAVFGDIDGVLHPPPSLRGPQSVAGLALASAQQMRQQGLFCWAHHLEDALVVAEQCTGDEFPLVIHSTWRKQPWASLQLLREALGPLGHRLMAMTSPDLSREASILDLSERAGIDDYIVFDDAAAEFWSRIDHLVITNPLRGVSDPAVLSALHDWAGAGCRHSSALKAAVA